MDYRKKVIKCLTGLKILSKNNSYFITRANYGPSKPTRIPLIIDEKLACFIAAIIGDGHLNIDKMQIRIDGFNKDLLDAFKSLSKMLFDRMFNITSWLEKEKPRYCLRMDSKALYLLFNKVFEIPYGKKSDIVKVPNYIFIQNKSIKAAFIIGLLVTEGGSRRRGIGLSTASKSLWEDLSRLFADLSLRISRDKWIYKKYNREYYGISFLKKRMSILKEACQDKKILDLLETCPSLK